MPTSNGQNSPNNKPIPVGRLVSVNGKPYRAPSTPRAAAKTDLPSGQNHSPHTNKTSITNPSTSYFGFNYLTLGVVVGLLSLATLGTWLTLTRHRGTPEVAAVEPPSVVAEEPAPLIQGETPHIVQAKPETLPLPAVVDDLPFVKPQKTEPVVIVPTSTPRPEAITELPIEMEPANPNPPERQPTETPTIVVKGKEPVPGWSKVLEMADKPKPGKCANYGTKINFFSMPTEANEEARKDREKLVMVLHIAGNFEEKGFT